MIDIRTGELADILPDDFTRQPQVLAISYALKQAYSTFLTYQDQLYLWAFIDNAPEFVLDLMMVEMRVKYPGTDLDADVKRSLIKTAMIVGLKDGTKWAVEEMINAIYGNGYVTEWYEYNGTPNHFRIDIIPEKTSDYNLILDVLDSVKRKTARLDAIRVWYDLAQTIYAGFGSMVVITQSNKMEPVSMYDHYVDELGNMLMDEANNVMVAE